MIQIAKSLAMVQSEIEQAKRRHPASWAKDDDPHPVKDHRGEGWKRVYPGVILFERREAG